VLAPSSGGERDMLIDAIAGVEATMWRDNRFGDLGGDKSVAMTCSLHGNDL
jgi:hypothetical protein